MKAELKNGMRYTDLDNGYLFFVACIIMLFGSLMLMPLESKVPDYVNYGLTVAFPYLLIGGALFFFMFKFKLQLHVGDVVPNIMQVFLMLPIFLCMYPIAEFLTRLSAILVPSTDLVMTEEILGYLDKLGPVAGWVILAVIPATVEEFLFRGFIFGSMRNYGFKCALILSSVCFALFHMNMQQEMYALACGLIFGFVREYTKSVYPGIVLHGLFNTMGVLSVYRLQLAGTEYVEGKMNPMAEFICYAVFTIAALFGLVYFFGKLKTHSEYSEEKAIEEFNWKKIKLGYIFGIGMCLMITVLTLLP